MGNDERHQNLEFELIKTKEELNKVKAGYEDFIHLAAHDLQAPVRKITTLLDRFIHKTGEVIPDESKTYLDRINKGLEQLTSLINDISNLSQIKSNTETIASIDLNICLQKICSSYDTQIAQLDIEKLPTIQGDPELIKQLFTELITNAIKFRKPDVPLEITIKTSRISEEEKLVFNLPISNIYNKITVHDNGIGFNQQMAERIFIPFQRLHGNSTYKGNGIGLAICQKIVTNHNGILIGEGKENEGATFSVILPEIQN